MARAAQCDEESEREERRGKEYEQLLKEEKARNESRLNAWARYPDDIQQIFRSVDRTNDGKLAALGQIVGMFNMFKCEDPTKIGFEEGMESLLNTSPMKAEIAYTRLRKILTPFVIGFWRIRHQFPPVAAVSLQHLAECLLYADISAVKPLLQKQRSGIRQILTEVSDFLPGWAQGADERIRGLKRADERIRELKNTLRNNLPPGVLDPDLKAIAEANPISSPWRCCSKCSLFVQEVLPNWNSPRCGAVY